ncbi:hypothetical protein ACFL6M_06800, partial [Candidatus Eisenbacteria bacterium]
MRPRLLRTALLRFGVCAIATLLLVGTSTDSGGEDTIFTLHPRSSPPWFDEFARDMPADPDPFPSAPPSDQDQFWQSGFHRPGFNSSICASVVYRGDLFLSGWFSYVNGIRAPRIARWDGTQWHDVSGGMDAAVCALTVW